MGHLQAAVDGLNRPQEGVRVTEVSPVYESPHLGLDPDDALKYPAHLNAVACAETRLSPQALLDHVRRVEAEGARQRSVRWGPRTIDVDILTYGDRFIDLLDLRIPHASLGDRAFVVRPLADIAADLVLPDGTRLRDLASRPAIVAQTLEPYPAKLRLPGNTL
jgi:2-amino-4-hydroxy-6-hydroxymethyldihydropteridine diphosphokinase